MEEYISLLDKYGLHNTWMMIMENASGVVPDDISSKYEFGLAYLDKRSKKENGRYYTPNDVADLMSEWLVGLDGQNVCDVCCGTGNLILSYLRKIGKTEAIRLLQNGNIYLYDNDKTALYICKQTLLILYGNVANNAHYIEKDFLDSRVVIPADSKIISNPPYFGIREIRPEWEITENMKTSREFYSCIMEKIIKSGNSVIISPYSFLGGNKFSELRKVMSTKGGFIVAFDNVPGNIFSGKKHGIFNSNTTNSVRAAITVVDDRLKNGFRCSGFIRFKNSEREQLLQTKTVESFIGKEVQNTANGQRFAKCFPETEQLYKEWKNYKPISFGGDYRLCFPNTCRYYTVASLRDLNRTGKYILSFETEEEQKLAYCFYNSSFCYLYWRIMDGGITYPLSLLKEMPVFFEKLTDGQKQELLCIADEMMENEEQYLVYKKNAGELQENIKFPDFYRNKINQIFLRALDVSISFERIHSNTALSTPPPKRLGLELEGE